MFGIRVVKERKRNFRIGKFTRLIVENVGLEV
jgi:hypothetical protein